jgi:ubiquinone/menaquinone biosynthesis C-methylase UbiE
MTERRAKMPSEKPGIFDYYDERAPEYEVFYEGGLPAKLSDPAVYRNDTSAIAKLLPDYIGGECIDIACGTGFWLPFCEKNCSRITLIDQSESMLAECRKKIEKLGIANKTEIIQGDLFGYPFKEHEYDSAIVGFLLSHLDDAEEAGFFHILKGVLKEEGAFVIIDDVWSPEVAATGRAKAGQLKRSLSDGRQFEISKRYFEKSDLENLAEEHGLKLEIAYWGRVFFLATASFSGG